MTGRRCCPDGRATEFQRHDRLAQNRRACGGAAQPVDILGPLEAEAHGRHARVFQQIRRCVGHRHAGLIAATDQMRDRQAPVGKNAVAQKAAALTDDGHTAGRMRAAKVVHHRRQRVDEVDQPDRVRAQQRHIARSFGQRIVQISVACFAKAAALQITARHPSARSCAITVMAAWRATPTKAKSGGCGRSASVLVQANPSI